METSVWIESIGWLASALTVATYSVNTMMPLRVLALGSSVFFVAYGLLLQLWPLVAMEAILLPINGYRLWQLLALRGRLSSVQDIEGPDFAIVKRYGRKTTFKAGLSIFHKGEPVDQFYYIARGRVSIDERQVELSAGDVFGEIAFFSASETRTASARTLDDTVVYALDRKGFMRLQFEDPSFGLAIMRTMTSRLLANSNSGQTQPASVP
ncbi:MAG: cyclic nucleotide-binding domain-containing protein [Pseudomonadota bacterium]